MKLKYIAVVSLYLLVGAGRIHADRVLDYETGDFFEGEYSDRKLWPVYDIKEDGLSRVMDCVFNYAIVENSPWYAGCVRWLIPGFVYSDWEGKPEVPIDGFSFELPEGFTSVKITLLESEYKDFNYVLQPGLPPVPDSQAQIFVDIEPYEGFFPEEPFSDNGTGIYRDTYIQFIGIRPVQYDYEHSIVRAYTHLSFRIDYLKENAGIETYGLEQVQPEYFSLQGIRVSKPVPGTVYIKRTGNYTEKILYLQK